MTDPNRPNAKPDDIPEHPSQAEGTDPSRDEQHPDPQIHGHPSQAEGEDPEDLNRG